MNYSRQDEPHGPPGKTTQESPVKQAISSAGLELFARQGYAQTSVREIVSMAGTTLPMIYYYFESKQGLYTYILQQSALHLLQSMDPKQGGIDTAYGSATQRLEAGVSSFLRFCQENRAEVQLVFAAWFGGDLPPEGPSVITVYEKMVEQIVLLLQSGIDSGEFRTLDVWEAGQALIGIMTNFVARILVGNETFDPVSQSHQTVELLVRGLERKAK
ncbi:MAG: TetR/AcrR family transcriptional regulator [Firmicutes bacterium]|nr:TetR/AcrR family transcriptional regulator [Bacillota bacterium]